MNYTTLLDHWVNQEDSAYTEKQVSVRLTLKTANQLDRLLNRFKHQSKTQLINELLAAALEELSLDPELKEILYPNAD